MICLVDISEPLASTHRDIETEQYRLNQFGYPESLPLIEDRKGLEPSVNILLLLCPGWRMRHLDLSTTESSSNSQRNEDSFPILETSKHLFSLLKVAELSNESDL